jgi:hypothetical protein
VLGRGDDSDGVTPDPYVRRQHVALLRDGTRCLLEDRSGQSTLVAGKPMTHGKLPDGADLQLGQWRAVFRQCGAAGAEDPTRRGLHSDVQSRAAHEDGLPPAQVRVKQGTTEFLHPIGAAGFTLGKDPANALVIQDRFISSQPPPSVQYVPEGLAAALHELVANALVNKGVTLGELGRHQEAIASYEEVLSRVGDAKEVSLRELVAKALNGVGFALC